MKNYDLIVIGTGPAGEKAAVKAAYFGYNVAIVEKNKRFGGAAAITGTLPSKTLKETALYFSGKYDKGLYGVERDLHREASLEDFMFRKNFVTEAETEVIRTNLQQHKVDIYHAIASFDEAHIIKLQMENKTEYIQGKYILVATGSYPFHPPGIPFDNERIHDSDTILEIKRLPSSLCVVGAGVIGCEYATIFSTMGTKVHLVNNSDKILSFLDQEVAHALIQTMQDGGVTWHFNTSIAKLQVPKDPAELIQVELENQTSFSVDMFLFAAGRSGQIQDLNCEKIGLATGKRATILVDKTYKTNLPHIYAVGDVIGFPALASTSGDQGRVAVAHMFRTKDLDNLPSFFPYGIYTIPEISTVGMSEDLAQEKQLSYCVGKAHYANTARGKIIGAQNGFLKLVFDRKSLTILGVHIIGNLASEIIHYGLLLVEEKKTLYNVIGTVFNFPTLHDLYKYAAYDGLSNVTGHKIKIS